MTFGWLIGSFLAKSKSGHVLRIDCGIVIHGIHHCDSRSAARSGRSAYAEAIGRLLRAIARYWGIWHDWAKAALMRALGACQRVVVMEDWP